MAKRTPVEIQTPCCGSIIKVTARQSRIFMRPLRNHRCGSCGKKYLVNAAHPKEKPVLVS